jgi:hypothetical protein
VDYNDGLFTVSIWVVGIDHHGSVGYDDNRDTTPDREEPSEGLGAYELTVTYEPALLEATGGAAGTFLGSTGRSVQCFGRSPEPGQYSLGCISKGGAPGPQGAGQLAEITFRPLTSGISGLELSAELGGPLADDIPVVLDSGLVSIENGPPPPTPPPPNDSTPTPGPTASPPPMVSLPEDGTPAHVPIGLVLPDYLDPTNQNDADDPNDPTSGPVAGTGYQARETPIEFVVLGAALAFAGAGLLGAGWRLRRRTAR